MKKTMQKCISAILGAVSALCIIFGGVSAVKDDAIITSSAEMVTSTEWSLVAGAATATYDDATGNTTFSNTNWEWGHHMTTNTPVALDGLTLTLGANHQKSGERFGLALTPAKSTSLAEYPLETKDNVKIYIEYNLYGQVRLFFDNDHDRDNNKKEDQKIDTLTYLDPNGDQKGFSNAGGPCEAYVSSLTDSYEYVLTFKYEGLHLHSSGSYSYSYWSITVVQTVGTAISANPLTVYLLDGQIAPFSGQDATCYLSSWGIPDKDITDKDYSFYTKIDEKPEVQKRVEEYAEIKGNSASDAATADAARQAAVDAIAALPEAEQTAYLGQLAEIDLAYYEHVKKNASENVEDVWAAREAAVKAIAALPEAEQATYSETLSEKDAADHRWVARTSETATPGYNITTGHSVLAPKAWGHGYTYTEKVELDGLTVILGSDEHLEKSRIGFGLVSELGGYPLHETDMLGGTVNFMLIPQYTDYIVSGEDTGYDLDGLFVIDSHDETPYPENNDTFNKESETLYTILYADEACTKNYLCERGGQKLPWLPSVASKRTAYSVTFNKCTNGNYKVTIRLLNGQAYGSTDDIVAYLPAAQLEGVVDSAGYCYVAAWGWSQSPGGLIYPFYADVMDSEYAEKYTATVSAQEKYEEAIRTSADLSADASELDSMKQAISESVSGLNCYHYLGAQYRAEELNSLRETMAGLKQTASLTVQESLKFNYKLTLPDEILANFGGITVKVSVDDESYTYDVGNFTNTADGKWACPIVDLGPQWMTESISLEVKAIDPNGDLLFQREISAYTLKTYCDALLADGSASTEMKNAVADLLNYGAAAQTYVNRNTDKLANAGVTYISTTQANPADAKNILAVNQGEEVQFTSITAHLKEQVTAYAKFKYDGDASLLLITMQVDGGDASSILATSLGNGYYCVESTALSPLQFDDEIIFRIFVNGNLDAKCTFSINSYIQRNYTHGKAGALITALYQYSVGVSNYAKVLPANVLLDTAFDNGLKTSTGNLSTGNSATPSWMVQETGSNNQLQATSNTSFVYTFADASKKLEINKNTDTLYMEVNASAEYTSDRTEGQPWPHLLLQQDYYNDDLVRLSEQSSLRMQMDYTITKCEDKSYGTANPNLHSAQFVWYITLQNRTEGHAAYGQYMWFGILLFDNRNIGKSINASLAADTGKSDATGMWIYQPATSAWAPNGVSPDVNQAVSLNLDIIPLAKAAFEEAKKQGSFATTAWEDLYIGSTNFGFEVPGTYDIGVEIGNMGIFYTAKTE